MRIESLSAERSCDDVLMLISAECDGAASEEEKLAVARHVARCGPCARARADFLSMGAELAKADDLAGATPGPEVWQAIEAHLSAPIRSAGITRAAGSDIEPAGPHAPPGAASPWRSWTRLARAAAVAGAVGGAFFAGRASAPAPLTPKGEGAAVAQAGPVSREAEEKAIVALVDALFLGGGEPGAAAKPRSMSTEATRPGGGASKGKTEKY